jgi:hypothetical protein
LARDEKEEGGVPCPPPWPISGFDAGVRDYVRSIGSGEREKRKKQMKGREEREIERVEEFQSSGRRGGRATRVDGAKPRRRSLRLKE